MKHKHEWKTKWIPGEADSGYYIYCDCGQEWAPEDLIDEIEETDRLRGQLTALRSRDNQGLVITVIAEKLEQMAHELEGWKQLALSWCEECPHRLQQSGVKS